jgi:hypothetical protein
MEKNREAEEEEKSFCSGVIFVLRDLYFMVLYMIRIVRNVIISMLDRIMFCMNFKKVFVMRYMLFEDMRFELINRFKRYFERFVGPLIEEYRVRVRSVVIIVVEAMYILIFLFRL